MFEKFYKLYDIKLYYKYLVVKNKKEYLFNKEQLVNFVKQNDDYLLLKVIKYNPKLTDHILLKIICIISKFYSDYYYELFYDYNKKFVLCANNIKELKKNVLEYSIECLKYEEFTESKENIRKLFNNVESEIK